MASSLTPKEYYLQLASFLQDMTQGFGEAAYLDDNACKKYFDKLRKDTLFPGEFYLAVDVLSPEIVFEYGLKSYINSHESGAVSLQQLITELIHPQYLEQYIQLCQNAYQLLHTQKDILAPLQQAFILQIPVLLQFENGLKQYYWVSQASFPLQLDAQNNMLSHLNRYQVLEPYSEYHLKPLNIVFFDGNLPAPPWSLEVENWLRELFKAVFTAREWEILLLYAENAKRRSKNIGEILEISPHTVRQHQKEIMRKIKERLNMTFPSTIDFVKYYANVIKKE